MRRFVRFPIDSGIAPAHRGNGERVRNLRFGSVALRGRYAARDTLQGALGQVEIHDVFAELSDVARQGEARLVGAEIDVAALRLHADDLERQHPCARDRISELAMLKGRYAFWN